MTVPRVVLKPKRAEPFFGRHPWVYAGAIAAVAGEPADGAEVDLHSSAGNFVARGLYNSRSKIRVRLYSWQPDVPLNRDFFRQQVDRAWRLRRDLLRLDRACRVVFSESDGLSGLVVDRFNDWLVLQFTSLALAERRELFADIVTEMFDPRGIFLRTEKGIGKLEGIVLHDSLMRGEAPTEDVTIDECGLRFRVNLREGQKTGFYFDQRDNRQAVTRYAAGRRMLDAFCYSGGFALHAARAGAAHVLGIDASENAVALAQSNAELNGIDNAVFRRADVFDALAELQKAGERFDLIVLDPPKFARSRHAVPEALKGYRRLLTLAVRMLTPDAILVMCCCTGLVTLDMLEELMAQISAKEGRPLQLLERRGQAPDHPVAVSCRESAYLKCLIARVL